MDTWMDTWMYTWMDTWMYTWMYTRDPWRARATAPDLEQYINGDHGPPSYDAHTKGPKTGDKGQMG